ncbi:MAG: hypothetical protein H6760_04790 [Candidatus Nomurabacteria bacterium]|nr:MAG: hypothetical protein H6760_04790 [Candidatus Nomurabacteria bacterium]
MPLQSFQSLIGRSLRKANIVPQVEATQVFDVMKGCIQQILTQNIQADISLDTFKHNIITLRVSSAALANQLRAHEARIRQDFAAAYQKRYGHSVRLQAIRYRLR